MYYSDEHYGGSKAAYDGELIDLEDAVARYQRDRELEEKYVEAEQEVEELQLTWSDLKKKLED